MRGLVRVVAAGMLLSACATGTPYQPYRSHFAGGIHGGYSEQRLAPDRYLVRFHGNSLTSRDRVEGYMLYRAAELTVQNGFDWFLVLDRNVEHNVHTIVRPDPLYRAQYPPGYEGWRPDWNIYTRRGGWSSWYGSGSPSWSEKYDVRQIEAFETSAQIQMNRAPMPANDARGIDARKALLDLGPTIERPKS